MSKIVGTITIHGREDVWVYSNCTQAPEGRPHMCLGTDNETMSFLDMVKMKRKIVKKGSDDAIMKAYIAYHSKCSRRQNGKLVNGAYVENEMIAAVAKQTGIIIKVAAHSVALLQIITPQGTYMQSDDHEAQASPFFLWCNGGHYQAIVPLSNLEVVNTALTKFSFIEGNALLCDDIRTQ